MTNHYPKLYEDTYGWAIHTAELLRSNKMNEVNFDEVLEEIEALGRSEKHELINRLVILIMHLLKWQYQSTMRGHSWKYSIIEQRKQVKIHFKDNPSLKSKLDEILIDAYDVAVSKAIQQTGLEEKVFPTECPYTFDQIIDNDFFPY